MDYGRYLSDTSPGRINQKLRRKRHGFAIAFLCVTIHSITLTALCSFPLCHYTRHTTLCLCLSQQFITIALQCHALPLRFVSQLFSAWRHNAIARRCRSIPWHHTTTHNLRRTSPLPCDTTPRNGALHCLCFSTQVSAFAPLRIAAPRYCFSAPLPALLFSNHAILYLTRPQRSLASQNRYVTTLSITGHYLSVTIRRGAVPLRNTLPPKRATPRVSPLPKTF